MANVADLRDLLLVHEALDSDAIAISQPDIHSEISYVKTRMAAATRILVDVRPSVSMKMLCK
jgi:hypothetical protein